MRTRQKRVATDTWRSLGSRTTPLEHWSKGKPTVEPRWAEQQTKKLRPKPTKINSLNKRDDFDFDIVNFPFLDGDVPRSTSYGVYISQLIRFARVSSHVPDFNDRNKSLTAKLLQQGYRYHKFRKTFSKFYRRHYELVSKYNVGLKTLLHQGLSDQEFYGDLVYKFKNKL